MPEKRSYVGFHQDGHGLTALGRVVLDAWVFGLIPREEDCAGWDAQRMQQLLMQVNARWDEYGHLPSFLPEELRARHQEIYDWAMRRARSLGWNPEPDEDE
ncbi:MAG: hypothetical protein NZ524_07855 [Thiobacillaceae bacterium]|nr:hypothetical protein [Thiobacillaceae bacterium]MCX7673116.1 hypothetical protein [Thiobacillaceae bacterium]MDW8323496.1 hypothetical protein [Burkholderiales bacterium]